MAEKRAPKMRFFIFLGLAALGLVSFQNFSTVTPASAPVQANAQSPACRLPRDVSSRIGVAQIFVNNLQNRTADLSKRDFVWGDNPTSEKVSGSYDSVYMPFDRDMSRSHAFDTVTNQSSYYSTNRTNWVVYLADGKTPAKSFCYPRCTEPNGEPTVGSFYYAPVDIATASVSRTLFNDYLSPALKSTQHPFDAIALDNVTSYNIGQRVGIRAKTGEFVKRYSGERVDKAFTDSVVIHLKRLTAMAHGLGACAAANNKFYLSDVEGFNRVVAVIDIDVDETGFSEHLRDSKCGNKPNSTFVNSPSKPQWTQRMTALSKIANDPRKGLVIIDKPCLHQSDIQSEMLQWPLANYLLIKGSHSYLSVVGIEKEKKESSFLDFAEYYTPTGQPLEDMATDGQVFWRNFEKLKVYVNPSTTSATVDLGPKIYHEVFTHAKLTGRVKLDSMNALVLQ